MLVPFMPSRVFCQSRNHFGDELRSHVVLPTGFGGQRSVDMLVDEQLARIC